MKKLIIVLLCVPIIVLGQKRSSNLSWFIVGLRGGYGSSLIYNNPSFDDNNLTYRYFSPTYFVNGRLGIIFGDIVGLAFDGGLSDYSQKINIIKQIERKITLNTYEYGPILILQSLTGFFFEVGPKFSTITRCYATDDNSGSNSFENYVTPKFTKLNFAIGIKPIMTDYFELKIGINGSYGFDNLVNEGGIILATHGQNKYIPTYTNIKTTPIQAMLGVELTYIFARYGRASCGRYRFMFNN